MSTIPEDDWRGYELANCVPNGCSPRTGGPCKRVACSRLFSGGRIDCSWRSPSASRSQYELPEETRRGIELEDAAGAARDRAARKAIIAMERDHPGEFAMLPYALFRVAGEQAIEVSVPRKYDF
jgi:hypothetical protein